MDRNTELLAEIRDLLQLMAEPQLAKRQKKFRDGIRKVVGRSKTGQNAVLLMDGTRTQAAIAKEAKIDAGQLNRLIKSLGKAELCALSDGRHPKLTERLPGHFFVQDGESDD